MKQCIFNAGTADAAAVILSKTAKIMAKIEENTMNLNDNPFAM